MTVNAAEDLYAVLGATPDATSDELSAARRRQLQYWHPDRNRQGKSLGRAQQINRAYDLLSDPIYRAEYDRQRGYSDARPAAPPPTSMSTVVPTPSVRLADPRRRRRLLLLTASGLVVIVIVGVVYLDSLPKPAVLQAASTSPHSTTAAALATRVTAPASALVLELADVTEILPGNGWTEPSGSALVNLSALSSATSAFAYGSGTPVQVLSQVLVLDSDASAASTYSAAVGAVAYPPTTDLSISEGQETSLLRSHDAVWRDPGPNGNFTGAYTTYDRYQYVLVWREHNVVALISFEIDGFNLHFLQPLADREETRIQGVLRP